MHFVKRESRLTSVDLNLCLFRLEHPWYVVLGMSHETYDELPEHIDVFVFLSVVAMRVSQVVPESLTDDVVKRNG